MPERVSWVPGPRQGHLVCGKCGQLLGRGSTDCGTVNASDARYCKACAKPLVEFEEEEVEEEEVPLPT